VLAAAGFVVALVSLALPWAHFRVEAEVPGQADETASGSIAVFQLDRGVWYVLILLAMLGLLAGAATARGRPARLAGAVSVVLGLAGMLLTNTVSSGLSAASLSSMSGLFGAVDLDTWAGSGADYGLVAPMLLGLGAALLSVRTPTGR
jgi:hypothetical protein